LVALVLSGQSVRKCSLGQGRVAQIVKQLCRFHFSFLVAFAETLE